MNLSLVRTLNTLNKYEHKKLPQKISYAIMKNLVSLQQEYDLYEKQLEKIFREYEDKTIKDKDGKIVFNKSGLPVVKDDYIDSFNEEIKELLNTEVEVEIYQIDDELFNYEENNRYDNLTTKEIIELSAIIC